MKEHVDCVDEVEEASYHSSCASLYRNRSDSHRSMANPTLCLIFDSIEAGHL